MPQNAAGQPNPHVDRGWAWVVVAAAFTNLVVMVGASRAFGIIFVQLIDDYGASSSVAATTYALVAALSYYPAPIYVTAADLLTCRAVVGCGGLVGSVGLICASFSRSLTSIVVFYGVLYGIACGLVLTPCPVILTKYFTKRRSLANGITFSGSSCGGVIMPFVLTFLLNAYGLHGTLLVLGGLVLNVVPMSCLFRPVPRPPQPSPGLDALDLDDQRSTDDDPPQGGIAVSPKSSHLEKGLETIVEGEEDDSITQTSPPSTKGATPVPPAEEDAQGDRAVLLWRSGSHQPTPEGHLYDGLYPGIPFGSQLSFAASSFLSVFSRGEEDGLKHQSASELSMYGSALDMALQTFSMQDLPIAVEDLGCDPAVRRSLREKGLILLRRLFYVRKTDSGRLEPVFDFHMLKYGQLWCLFCGNAAGLALWYVVMLLPARARELKLPGTDKAVLIAVLGIFDAFGRLGGGFVCDTALVRPRLRQVQWILLLTAACGLCNLVWQTTRTGLIAVLCLFQPFFGAYVACCPVVVSDVVGTRNMSKAWGLNLCIQATSVTLTPVIIGLLADSFGSFDSGFYFILCMGIIGVTFYWIALLWPRIPGAVTYPALCDHGEAEDGE